MKFLSLAVVTVCVCIYVYNCLISKMSGLGHAKGMPKGMPKTRLAWEGDANYIKQGDVSNRSKDI